MPGARKGSEICTEGVGELDARLHEGVRDLHRRGRRAGCRMPDARLHEGVRDLLHKTGF